MSIIFKGLEIKQSYEQIDGNYKYIWKGKFHVESEDGSHLHIAVTPELCEKLIAVCADNIIEVAKEAAESMVASMLQVDPVEKIEEVVEEIPKKKRKRK